MIVFLPFSDLDHSSYEWNTAGRMMMKNNFKNIYFINLGNLLCQTFSNFFLFCTNRNLPQQFSIISILLTNSRIGRVWNSCIFSNLLLLVITKILLPPIQSTCHIWNLHKYLGKKWTMIKSVYI